MLLSISKEYRGRLIDIFKGATFFSESQTMDDRELLAPILESYGIFKPLKTVSLMSLHILATLALVVTAIVYAVLTPDVSMKCREYFLLIYIQIGLWFFTLVSYYVFNFNF